MPCFLDTSALVKLYVREPGTEAMLRLLDGIAEDALVVAAIAGVEFASAVRTLERTQKLGSPAATELLARFREHWNQRYIQQPITSPVLDAATDLVGRHSLRAYDAVQLASCLAASRGWSDRPMQFICSDQRLLRAAAGEGLACLDPSAP